MSFKEWKEYKLGELGKLARGKSKHRPRDAAFLYGGIYPFIQTGDIKSANHKIRKHSQTLSNEGLKQSKLWDAGTICLTIAANIGDSGILTYPACFPDSVLGFVVDNSKADAEFIEYLLQFYKKNIQSHAIGSVQDNINLGTFENIKFKIPTFETQKKISFLLSSLDEKIELNRRTNQTLETIAQTLFKEMCVPTSKILPEGWKVVLLNNVLEIKYGKDHKHLENGSIPLYGSGGIMRFVNKSLYEEESILIPRKGTLSNLFYINKPFWSVDTMFYTKIKDKIHTKFLFLLLKSMNLATMNVGSAVPSLTTEILNRLEIFIPPISILKSFDLRVTPFFEMLEINEEENKTLIATRDILLPKLMKGEIEL